MARVPDLTVDDLAEADRDLLKRPIALHKALTNSPKAAREILKLIREARG